MNVEKAAKSLTYIKITLLVENVRNVTLDIVRVN